MDLTKKIYINCFILNGGKSTRMTRDKAKITINGKSFVENVIEELAPIFKKCFLVGKEYHHPFIAGWLEDIIKGIGPIGGLYTALQNTDTLCNFVTAIDYPLVNRKLVYALWQKVENLLNIHDAIIPVYDDGPHPLFGFYRKTCIKAIEKCIKNKKFSILGISDYCNIAFSDIKKILPDRDKILLETSLMNINTPDDYKKLLKMLKNIEK